MSDNIPTLTITGLINDLKSGITRCKGDLGYEEEKGSIQEKYNLAKSDVKEIFKHPELMGIKVSKPKKPKYILINDKVSGSTTNVEAPTQPSTEEAKKYGAPTASGLARAENTAEIQNDTPVAETEDVLNF